MWRGGTNGGMVELHGGCREGGFKQDRNICPTPIFSINLGLAEFSYTISL